MLQSIMVKRVERLQRWRMLFMLHLALYGLGIIGLTLASMYQPALWVSLVIAIWLPLILAHTIVFTLYELRERCAYQPQPAEAFNFPLRPVDLYDEQGNVLTGDAPKLELLPSVTRGANRTRSL